MAGIETLEASLGEHARQTESLFRAALAREDLARMARLRELAESAESAEAFAEGALFVGWTAGDLRSGDLAHAIEPFARAFWSTVREGGEPDLMDEWNRFSAERMRILIHCL